MRKVSKKSLRAGQTVYSVVNGKIETYIIRSKPYTPEHSRNKGYGRNEMLFCDNAANWDRAFTIDHGFSLGDCGVTERRDNLRKTFYSRKRAESWLKLYGEKQKQWLAAWQAECKAMFFGGKMLWNSYEQSY